MVKGEMYQLARDLNGVRRTTKIISAAAYLAAEADLIIPYKQNSGDGGFTIILDNQIHSGILEWERTEDAGTIERTMGGEDWLNRLSKFDKEETWSFEDITELYLVMKSLFRLREPDAHEASKLTLGLAYNIKESNG